MIARAKRPEILLLAGDGVGPEVMTAARTVIDWFQASGRTSFAISEGLVGGASYDAYGEPLTEETLAAARRADAILLGAVGGPKWETLPFASRPERGILGLRKELGLFANLRPAQVFDALVQASTLKPEVVNRLDIMIVRELTGGVYFGEPRGIETLPNGERRGVNTQKYTTHEILRVARIAFELARKRRGKVCSVDKANVMESGLLWREEVTGLHGRAFADVALSHMYADTCAMQLVRQPEQFDVIVTDNLFGDILSDLASMLTGSIGMLPSASLGAVGPDGRQPALYEPIHGSAPDIAGKGIANPLAMILSFAMMMRYSFALDSCADLLEDAVSRALTAGARTADLAGSGKAISTATMTEVVIAELDRAVASDVRAVS